MRTGHAATIRYGIHVGRQAFAEKLSPITFENYLVSVFGYGHQATLISRAAQRAYYNLQKEES